MRTCVLKAKILAWSMALLHPQEGRQLLNFALLSAEQCQHQCHSTAAPGHHTYSCWEGAHQLRHWSAGYISTSHHTCIVLLKADMRATESGLSVYNVFFTTDKVTDCSHTAMSLQNWLTTSILNVSHHIAKASPCNDVITRSAGVQESL